MEPHHKGSLECTPSSNEATHKKQQVLSKMSLDSSSAVMKPHGSGSQERTPSSKLQLSKGDDSPKEKRQEELLKRLKELVKKRDEEMMKKLYERYEESVKKRYEERGKAFIESTPNLPEKSAMNLPAKSIPKATLERRLHPKDFRFITDISFRKRLASGVNNETLLHRIQMERGWRFQHHNIELQIQMDLIWDGRLVPTCNLRINQIEWYFKSRKRPPSIDVETIMPCEQCLKKNAAGEKSICNLFAFWKYWGVRVPNNETEQCVKDENIILIANMLQYDDQSILMKCLTFHASKSLKRTVSKLIEKKVYKLLAWSFEYMEVFLSIKDTDSKPVILVLFHRNKVRRYPRQIHGIELVLKPIQQLKNETERRVILPCAKKENISSERLSSLFNDHSNLNEISFSNHKETSESIITFHCWAKGMIPFGEDLFPKQAAGLKTEVKEGFAWLSSGDSLHLGDEIGVLRDGCVASTGTAGGFLEKNKTSYLLTCAHVLYNEKELAISPSLSLSLPRLPVVSGDKSKVYGERYDFVFNHSNSEKISVDAAVVKLDEAVKLQATIPEENDHRLSKAGFEAQPVFNSGRIADVRKLDLFDRCCIKFGSVTGLTRGSFCLHGKHARIKHIPLSLKQEAVDFPSCKAEPMEIDQDDITPEKFLCQRTSGFASNPLPASFLMFNQLEIDSHLSSGNFFKIGDSGSLVFLREPDESLTAIGLAIGSTSEGTCIVTPIISVLDELDNKIDPMKEKEKLHFKNNLPSVQPNVSQSVPQDANIGKTQVGFDRHRFRTYARNQIIVSDT